MKAVRVHRFGGPEVLAYEDIARPVSAAGEVLVRIAATGVGPWDGWIRAGRSALADDRQESRMTRFNSSAEFDICTEKQT